MRNTCCGVLLLAGVLLLRLRLNCLNRSGLNLRGLRSRLGLRCRLRRGLRSRSSGSGTDGRTADGAEFGIIRNGRTTSGTEHKLLLFLRRCTPSNLT